LKSEKKVEFANAKNARRKKGKKERKRKGKRKRKMKRLLSAFCNMEISSAGKSSTETRIVRLPHHFYVHITVPLRSSILLYEEIDF